MVPLATLFSRSHSRHRSASPHASPKAHLRCILQVASLSWYTKGKLSCSLPCHPKMPPALLCKAKFSLTHYCSHPIKHPFKKSSWIAKTGWSKEGGALGYGLLMSPIPHPLISLSTFANDQSPIPNPPPPPSW